MHRVRRKSLPTSADRKSVTVFLASIAHITTIGVDTDWTVAHNRPTRLAFGLLGQWETWKLLAKPRNQSCLFHRNQSSIFPCRISHFSYTAECIGRWARLEYIQQREHTHRIECRTIQSKEMGVHIQIMLFYWTCKFRVMVIFLQPSLRPD